MTTPIRVCVHGCDAPADLYPCGSRCENHRPLPVNPVPDPPRTLDGLRAAAGLPTHVVPTRSSGWAAVDARAIATGKRRANPWDQAAAKTEIAQQKQRRTA